MILVDTGPFVALFDPRDSLHNQCKATLRSIGEPLLTTIPVLTEVFHLLAPASLGSARLREFLLQGGVAIWFLDQVWTERAFSLMERYSDHPMDLADASLVVAAEALQTRKIFTLDRGDFSTYRIRRGHQHEAVEIIG